MNPKVVKILSYSSASILLSIPFLYFYIIGGNVTSTREYPFQAAIFVIGQNNRMNFYCGGKLQLNLIFFLILIFEIFFRRRYWSQ